MILTVLNKQISAQGKQALRSAFYEYFLITLPIGIYVSLEALHKHDLKFCWNSPEWAIATIFLSFQSISLYKLNLKKTGRILSEASFGLFSLIFLAVVVAASINAYLSLNDNSVLSIIFRLVLFCAISVTFVLMVGGAKLTLLKMEKHKNAS